MLRQIEQLDIILTKNHNITKRRYEDKGSIYQADDLVKVHEPLLVAANALKAEIIEQKSNAKLGEKDEVFEDFLKQLRISTPSDANFYYFNRISNCTLYLKERLASLTSKNTIESKTDVDSKPYISNLSVTKKAAEPAIPQIYQHLLQKKYFYKKDEIKNDNINKILKTKINSLNL